MKKTVVVQVGPGVFELRMASGYAMPGLSPVLHRGSDSECLRGQAECDEIAKGMDAGGVGGGLAAMEGIMKRHGAPQHAIDEAKRMARRDTTLIDELEELAVKLGIKLPKGPTPKPLPSSWTPFLDSYRPEPAELARVMGLPSCPSADCMGCLHRAAWNAAGVSPSLGMLKLAKHMEDTTGGAELRETVKRLGQENVKLRQRIDEERRVRAERSEKATKLHAERLAAVQAQLSMMTSVSADLRSVADRVIKERDEARRESMEVSADRADLRRDRDEIDRELGEAKRLLRESQAELRAAQSALIRALGGEGELAAALVDELHAPKTEVVTFYESDGGPLQKVEISETVEHDGRLPHGHESEPTAPTDASTSQ